MAIHEALAAGAHVINVSAGQSAPTGTAEPELMEAARACASAGVLIVAAVGNDGCDCLHVPASLPCVLSVGALRRDGSPLQASNWGSIYGKQGISAPGEDVPVAGPDGRRILRTGTSYATAIVSGVAALLLSRERKCGRAIRPLLIRKALLAAAAGSFPLDASRSRRLLAGRLEITRATNLLDHRSHTMTDETNLDLATQCNADANSPCDAPPVQVRSAARADVGVPSSMPIERFSGSEVRQEREAESVVPSGCGCGCQGGERQLVYALGQLDYDFGSEAALDAIKQQMDHEKKGTSPYNPADLRDFLKRHSDDEPWHVTTLLWTLNVGDLPLYVISPEGPYAQKAYTRLLEYFTDQFPKGDGDKMVAGTERVAVAGVITGQASLLNGQRVPVVNPDMRGLCNWSTQNLIGNPRSDSGKLGREFLDRVYFELRNAGRTSPERALNYAGTNLVEPEGIFKTEAAAKRVLDEIRVERSTVGRAGSDCWDITLAFFDPEKPVHTHRSIHRYTVDVSGVIPISIGKPRSWKAR